MKYLRQFCIILLVSALGEGLHILLPLPVPASVYGLVLMLGALASGILKLEQVEEAADFLVDFRYWEQAAQQCPGWDIIKIKGEDDVFSWLREHKLETLGIEDNFITVRFASLLKQKGHVSKTQGIDGVLTKPVSYTHLTLPTKA